MSSPSVKFALAGFGAWGQQHARCIAGDPDAELVAIVAPTDKSRALAAESYPAASIFEDHRDLIESAEFDVLDVVTPSHTHREIAGDALESGHHVLLEKPMALSVRECQELVAIARRENLVLAVGHELRLSSQWGEVKRLIDAGTIGDPRYVLVELSRKPYRLGASGWRYDAGRVGSWVLEEPIHFFDLARWYLQSQGDPVDVFATGNSIDPARPHLQDNFSAIVRHPTGAYAVVSQTLAAFEHHQTVKVTGTKGAIWAAWSGAMDRTFDPTFSLRVFDGEKVETATLTRKSGEVFELQEEIAMMVCCVREGEPPVASGEDGLWSVGLCLGAEESIRSNRTIVMADFLNSVPGGA